MSLKELIIQEIEQTPEFLLEKVLNFLQFIKVKHIHSKPQTFENERNNKGFRHRKSVNKQHW
ncbi:hypothetical protein Cal6303_0174 [Calothrix sp. PCC 6303]|nr:hypothetical protein Cal6303_0174 [Calothrix sp. PCC 6303]